MASAAALVYQKTISVGNGALSLTAVTGSRQIADAHPGSSPSNTFDYVVRDPVTGSFEEAAGYIGSDGKLVRGITIYSSSNAGDLVDFGAGSKDVFTDIAAAKQSQLHTLAFDLSQRTTEARVTQMINAAISSGQIIFTAAPLNKTLPVIGISGNNASLTPGTYDNFQQGYSTLSYQWTLNGTNISGATGTTINVSGLNGSLAVKEFAVNNFGQSSPSTSNALTVGTPAATITFTEPANNRIFPTSTVTGGASGRGSGTIPLAINLSASSPVYARLRKVEDGTILKDAYQVSASSPLGASTVNLTGVDAFLGWAYIDLAASATGPWRQGTNRIGMGWGFCIGPAQSQAVRKLYMSSTSTGTNASLGVAISPYGSISASYDAYSAAEWALPADGGVYNSTFASEFLRLMIAITGVNCFITGHAVGDTALSAWQPGTANCNKLLANIAAVRGYTVLFPDIGGNDAGAGTPASAYQTAVTNVISAADAANVARGTSSAKVLCACATRLAGGAGSVSAVTEVRKGSKATAVALGGVYYEPHDVNLEDNVHQTQVGNIAWARAAYRATCQAMGLAINNNSPALVSGVRASSSKIIALTATLPAGASALIEQGDASSRFKVYTSGSYTTLWNVIDVSISGNTVNITLESDPGNTTALDVYIYLHPDPSGTLASVNNIYDNHLDSDGLTIGRQMEPNLTPVVVAAPGGSTPTSSSDTFTDVSGTNLAAHTADSGSTWAVPIGSFDIQANRTRATTGGSTAINSYVPPTADYSVKMRIVVLSVNLNQAIYACSRITGNTTYYLGGLSPDVGWRVGKRVNDAFNDLGQSGAFTINVGDVFDIRLEIIGSAIKLYASTNGGPEGAAKVSVTDTSITGIGKGGIRNSNLAAGVTTDHHIDNWQLVS